MKTFGVMLPDVSKSLFRRAATEYYPSIRKATPVQLRGLLHLKLEACTGCGLCAMDCPANAIQVTMLDRKAKIFTVDYHVDRCTFCGQCVESCRQGALHMSSTEWELAALDKTPFLMRIGDTRNAGTNVAAKPENKPAEDKHN
jgi:NADH-quinone oxidoreductase subunit I